MKLLSRESSKSILVAFSVSLGVILVVASAFGMYYEEYQALFNAMLSGKLSPGVPFDSWYFMAYIGISKIYSWLYQLNFQIEWIGWISVVFILISGMLLNKLFIRSIILEKGNLFGLISLVSFSFIILSDHVLNFHFARVSYLLCASSMLCMIIIFSSINSIKERKTLFFGLLLLFVLGTLTRSEPSIATALLLTCFAVVWHGKISQGLLSALPALSISLIVVIGILIDIHYTDDFHKLVEPDIEMQLTVRGNVVPLSNMTNAMDSLRYEGALRMIWGDPEIITVEFMRSLIDKAPYSSWDSSQWQRTLLILEEFVSKHFVAILFNTILLLLIVVFQAIMGRSLNALLTLLYLIGFFIAIAGQTYLVKMTPWSLSPYLSVFTAGNLLLGFREFRKGLWISALQFGLSAYVFVYAWMIWNSSEYLKSKHVYQKEVYVQAENIAKGQTLLITPSSFQPFLSATRPLVPFDFSSFKEVYFYESQLASILPGYRDYLEQECLCDVTNFSNFYRFLLDKQYPNKVFVMSTADRVDLITRYLKGIHQFEVVHEEVCPLAKKTFKLPNYQQQVMLYQLKTE